MDDVIANDPVVARARSDPDALWVAIGHHRRIFHFWSRAADDVLSFDSRSLCKEGAALELIPDRDHWARQWPKGGPKSWANAGTDWGAIGAHLIAECYRAGLWKPPEDWRPIEGARIGAGKLTQRPASHKAVTRIRAAVEAELRT